MIGVGFGYILLPFFLGIPTFILLSGYIERFITAKYVARLLPAPDYPFTSLPLAYACNVATALLMYGIARLSPRPDELLVTLFIVAAWLLPRFVAFITYVEPLDLVSSVKATLAAFLSSALMFAAYILASILTGYIYSAVSGVLA